MKVHRRQIIQGIGAGTALAASLSGGWGRGLAAAPDTRPIIAAASSLRFALEDIAAAFKRMTGQSVRLVYGSSGNLARQIRQGAPFEVFLSADENFAQDLTGNGFTVGGGVLYALGQLAIFAPEDSPIRLDGELSGLRRAVERGDIQRFAIANPEHAPYGRAAREALIHAGLWSAIEPYIVLGENVSQAAQFIVSGSCEGGIIAASLARAPGYAAKGSAKAISARFHQPLRQRMVLLKGADGIARAFYQFLQGDTARKILNAHGFSEPEAE